MIQYLLEQILIDPFYTPVNLWLQLIKKMDSHELETLIEIHEMEDVDLPEQQAMDLRYSIKRHMPGIHISKFFPEGEEERQDEYLYIGLN